uniref:Uncharacterized protein n=1 Tax=Ixodes ricinus TaxID=34613 RepID=A0A147BMJ9_IXORI
MFFCFFYCLELRCAGCFAPLLAAAHRPVTAFLAHIAETFFPFSALSVCISFATFVVLPEGVPSPVPYIQAPFQTPSP